LTVIQNEMELGGSKLAGLGSKPRAKTNMTFKTNTILVPRPFQWTCEQKFRDLSAEGRMDNRTLSVEPFLKLPPPVLEICTTPIASASLLIARKLNFCQQMWFEAKNQEKTRNLKTLLQCEESIHAANKRCRYFFLMK